MVSASMTVQHAKWLEGASDLAWRRPVPSLNVLLTSTCWRNDHNGFSHQGPGLIDTVLTKRGTVEPGLPAAGRQLPAVGRRPLPAQPRLREPDRHRQAAPAAVPDGRRGGACTARDGAGIWDWAGTETEADRQAGARRRGAGLRRRHPHPWRLLAAADLLRRHVPDLVFRVVNVVDLMRLNPAPQPSARHDPGRVHRAVHRRRRRGVRLPRLLDARCTSWSTARPTRSASTCAATASRAPRPRRSTWWCSTR